MKRRLFLHLGLPKTGTTSIQGFLRGNPDLLAAHGVCYPEVRGGTSVHPALAPSVLKRHPRGRANHLALAMEVRKSGRASEADRLQTPLWRDVLERIHSGDAHTVVISYENFYHRPDAYSFDSLAPLLADFDCAGIIYLRPQEDWVTSLYAQYVRGAGRLAAPLSDFVKRRNEQLSYSLMLDNVSAHIPLDHLIAADFEQASATGLLTDFLTKIGLPRGVEPPPGDRALINRSLPYWATLFLLKCNQAQIPDDTFLKVRKALTHGVTRNDFPPLRPGLDVATPEEREGLRAAAAADAQRLQAMYGVTLTQRAREPIAFRPFDQQDVGAIRRALAAEISRPALKELDKL